MLGRFSLVAIAVTITATAADARRQPRWQASRVVDPITNASRCVVSAYDQVIGRSFSRVGYLYPVVETNSGLGLLVGVSSGGRYRVPTGDILWRVDQQPHRVLRAADNPAIGEVAPMPAMPNLAPELQRQVQENYAASMRQVQAMTATSTVATGERAREMLREMLAGSQLIFRAAQAAPDYGLPSDQTFRVGQLSQDGLTPIPLDASFRTALTECGISVDSSGGAH